MPLSPRGIRRFLHTSPPVQWGTAKSGEILQVRHKEEELWFNERFASFEPDLRAAGSSVDALFACTTDNEVHAIMSSIGLEKRAPYLRAVKRIRRELEAEANAAKEVQPPWVQKCREAHGRKMQKFINDDGESWDTVGSDEL